MLQDPIALRWQLQEVATGSPQSQDHTRIRMIYVYKEEWYTILLTYMTHIWTQVVHMGEIF